MFATPDVNRICNRTRRQPHTRLRPPARRPAIGRIASAALVVIAVGLSSAPHVSAQSELRQHGDSLRMAGDLVGAYQAYFSEYARSGESAELAYAIAGTFALHGAYPDSAFHYLGVALEQDDSVRPLYDPDLYFITNDPRWPKVEDRQLDELARQIGGSFQRSYARDLLQIRMHEWTFRYHTMLAHRTLPPDSPILSALGWAMGEHHRQNEARLTPLLDKYGWPKLSAVGEDAAYAAGNVINHSGLATRQKYLPLLRAAAEAGEADWSRFAHIFDRTQLELGNRQVYGTQMEMNEETGRYEPRPMVEPDNVNERRAAKGMEPIEAQLKRFNESMQRDFGD